MISMPARKPKLDRARMVSDTPLKLDRKEQLDALDGGEFDMIVVGGGVTGAYTAMDAVLRGYRVALLEKDDFASGTSSKSSKMIHGGLRYIEQGNLPLVRHSLLERQRLRKNAAHLVQRLPFLFPPVLSQDASSTAGWRRVSRACCGPTTSPVAGGKASCTRSSVETRCWPTVLPSRPKTLKVASCTTTHAQTTPG